MLLMDIANIRRANMQALVDRYGLSVVAKQACKPDRQINDMLAGRKSFGEKVARSIEEKMGILRGELDRNLTGTPTRPPVQAEAISPGADFLPVRRVKLKPTAGITGYAVEDNGDVGKPIFFRADYLQTRGWNAEKLIAMRVSGSSMEPGLFDGDLIVIHTAMTTPHEGRAYVVNYEGEVLIKRLRRDQGAWWLSSDNADKRRYPDKRLDDEHAKIIGQVVYKQSEVI